MEKKEDHLEKVPHKISEYVKKYFGEEYKADIKTARHNDGHVYYHATINQNGTLYQLRFDAGGVLVQKETYPGVDLQDEKDEAGSDEE